MKKPILAGDLMSRPVRQLTGDVTLREAAAFLLRHGISGAPVIDGHGRWRGVFTLNDLARALASRALKAPQERTLEEREAVDWNARVVEAMTPGLVTVFPDATLGEVARAMASSRVHRVFVIDEKLGSLQGVITTMDLVRRLEGAGKGAAAVR